MVLPLAAMQRVAVPCPRCGHENVLLAAAVKKGSTLRCESCGRSFEVTETRALVGSSPARRGRKR